MCTIFASIFYLYIRIKKYFPILKMAEELIANLGYGAPQSDTKGQKLVECVLTGNSKLYLGKVYTEKQLTKLNEEEVEKNSSQPSADCSRYLILPSLFPMPTILVTKYKGFLCNLFLLWE